MGGTSLALRVRNRASVALQVGLAAGLAAAAGGGCGRIGYQPLAAPGPDGSGPRPGADAAAPDGRPGPADGLVDGSGWPAAGEAGRPGDDAEEDGGVDAAAAAGDAPATRGDGGLLAPDGPAPTAGKDAAPAGVDAPPPPALPIVIAAGETHACALRGEALSCWGNNSSGELGIGTTSHRSRPTPVAPGTAFASVSAADGRTCALTADGRILCWGANPSGELGTGAATPQTVPARVGTRTDWRRLVGRHHHFFAVDAQGRTWAWGRNDENQANPPSPSGPITAPVQVLAGASYGTLGTGQGHSCGLRADGTLWCWGRNSFGQSGQDPAMGRVYVPTQVGASSAWTALFVSAFYACAIPRDGSLWCWGDNGASQLGLGVIGDQSAPRRVGSFTDWREVSGDYLHTCGVRRNGTLWCWGRNAEGQLGFGPTTTNQATPAQVGTATDWASVAAGRLFTCATKVDGTLWCAGKNEFGSLGVGDIDPRATFTQVTF